MNLEEVKQYGKEENKKHFVLGWNRYCDFDAHLYVSSRIALIPSSGTFSNQYHCGSVYYLWKE